jgi:hypothetical protein
MGNGIYKLALQGGDWGYFAEIEIKVTIDNTLDVLEIDIGEECEDYWKSAVIFGITYAWEKLQSELTGCRVKIGKVRGFEVDTTQIVMAYCAMNAFWEAVGKKPTHMPTLKKESGIFIIPK